MTYSISANQIDSLYDAYLLYKIKIETRNLNKRKVENTKKESIKIADVSIRFNEREI